MSARLSIVSLLLLSLNLVAHGQTSSPRLPCKFSGELQRTPRGKIVEYSSQEMKDRATHKVDLSGFMRQLDINAGTVVVDVLVGTSGEVVCLKTRTKAPVIRVAVEIALRSWTFKRAEVGSRPVAYIGRLEFTLCNINCGEREASMSLLK